MIRLLRYFNTIAWLNFFLLFIGCSDSVKKPSKDDQKYSSTQKYLFQILDDYKADYFTTTKVQERESIQRTYQDKMKHFLVDSLRRYIDSMTVIVDTVIQEGWLVTTQFHAKDIEFKYGMRFKDSMPPSADSLYKFMINLLPGTEVTVDFVHLGGGELNYPDDKNKRTMRIFAYPEPIKNQK